MANATSTSKSALDILKEDHERVKQIFDRFENAEEESEKKELVTKAIEELKIHAALEEELVYPEGSEAGDEASELADEAIEEHHVVKLLISELENMEPDDERYDAKFTVLSENVKHHIEEEEGEFFPKLEKMGLDLQQLGIELQRRREEILEEQGAGGISEVEGTVSRRTGSRGRAGRKKSPGTQGRKRSKRSKR